MKKMLMAIAILLCSSVVFTACNNGDYDANPVTNNSGTGIPANTGGSGGGSFTWTTGTDPMSAKIDGVAFQADQGTATTINGIIAISGLSMATFESIQMGIPDNVTAGSTVTFSNTTIAIYNSGGSDVNALYSGLPVQGGNGAVKILENDATHIKGLFYMNAKNMAGAKKVITEGYFNVTKS